MNLGMTSATVVFIAFLWTASLFLSFFLGFWAGKDKNYVIRRTVYEPDYRDGSPVCFHTYYISKHISTSDPRMAMRFTAAGARREMLKLYDPRETVEIVSFKEACACSKT